ncbi:MAG: hypothetical protein KatS3mg031_0107 [Chitinophagales bacterium]|nr:MAG: hypothetical protein KatS3mg031_0107 [Chitinophagales bacterium]
MFKQIQSRYSVLQWRLQGILLFSIFILSACEKNDQTFQIDYKYSYFPIRQGHYVVYDVDSIVYNDNTGTVDSFHYQKKHVIDSMFTDNEGREAYRLVRYQRENASQQWQLTDVWYFVRTSSALEMVEENQRFVKLVFPPKTGLSWNGNKYITQTDNWWFWKPVPWEYQITELDVPASFGLLQFDSTLTVVQQDKESLIQKVKSVEQYAKNVGLVYKYFLALDKSKGDISRPWTEPDFGFIFTMQIVEYGME